LATVGSTEFPDLPITILEQNVDTVTFEIINTFDDQCSIYAQFDENRDDGCTAETNVLPLTDPITFTATCMQWAPIAIVDLYFTDLRSLNGFVDNAEIPKCCKAGDNPAVQYTFKLYCESQCGPMDRRMLPEDETVALERVKKAYLRSRKD